MVTQPRRGDDGPMTSEDGHSSPGTPASSPTAMPDREGALQWVTSLTVTTAFALLGASAGGLLAVFGLAGVALIVALMLIAFAATLWRAAALPLSVIAAATAVSASFAAGHADRLDRSSGALVVQPNDSVAAERETWKRGLGSVLVDLRGTQLRSDHPTRVTARSDAGRVVVALPADRCVNVRVRVRRTRSALDPSSAFTAVRQKAIDKNVLPRREVENSPLPESFNPVRGELSFVNRYGSRPGLPAVSVYGYTLFGDREVAYTRRSRDPRAPWVDLDLRAASSVIVRDYPAGDAILGRQAQAPPQDDPVNTLGGVYAELAGAEWPTSSGLPSPPRSNSDAAWSKWKQRGGVTAARDQAVLAAGGCAPREALTEHWTRVYGGPAVSASATSGQPAPEPVAAAQQRGGEGFAINGIGTLIRIGGSAR